MVLLAHVTLNGLGRYESIRLMLQWSGSNVDWWHILAMQFGNACLSSSTSIFAESHRATRHDTNRCIWWTRRIGPWPGWRWLVIAREDGGSLWGLSRKTFLCVMVAWAGWAHIRLILTYHATTEACEVLMHDPAKTHHIESHNVETRKMSSKWYSHHVESQIVDRSEEWPKILRKYFSKKLKNAQKCSGQERLITNFWMILRRKGARRSLGPCEHFRTKLVTHQWEKKTDTGLLEPFFFADVARIFFSKHVEYKIKMHTFRLFFAHNEIICNKIFLVRPKGCKS